MSHFFTYRRATQASADTADLAHECVAHIVGTVNHDCTTHRIVVEPWLKALHPQRIPVAADVGIARSKPAQAGSLATRCIGKRHRSEEHTSELQSLMRISYAR